MWIVAFLADLLIGFLIIGEPLGRLVFSPLFLILGGITFFIGWGAGKMAGSYNEVIKWVGIGLWVALIAGIALFIFSSTIRDMIVSVIGLPVPEVNFKNVSGLQLQNPT